MLFKLLYLRRDVMEVVHRSFTRLITGMKGKDCHMRKADWAKL